MLQGLKTSSTLNQPPPTSVHVHTRLGPVPRNRTRSYVFQQEVSTTPWRRKTASYNQYQELECRSPIIWATSLSVNCIDYLDSVSRYLDSKSIIIGLNFSILDLVDLSRSRI